MTHKANGRPCFATATNFAAATAATEQHRLLKGTHPDVNMHVFTIGSREITRMLMLRDWLRANGADRELYAATKRALASRHWKYVQHYADAKTTVVAEIMARAEAARKDED